MEETMQMVSAQAQLQRGERISSLNKKELDTVARMMLEVGEGNEVDSLDLIATAKKMQALWKEVETLAKEKNVERVRQYGREGISRLGVLLAVAEAGVTYDYQGDDYWQVLKQDADEATNKLTRHELFLRSLPLGGMVIANPETGETYLAHAPAKRATDTIKATVR